jgi:putative endonuclease
MGMDLRQSDAEGMGHNLQQGFSSEALVANEMQGRGYTVLGRNIRIMKGEIDIVCRNDKEMVFVEVRSLQDGSVEDCIGGVTRRKVWFVRRTAQMFLMDKPEDYEEVRFFLACVIWSEGKPEITIIEDAF